MVEKIALVISLLLTKYTRKNTVHFSCSSEKYLYKNYFVFLLRNMSLAHIEALWNKREVEDLERRSSEVKHSAETRQRRSSDVKHTAETRRRKHNMFYWTLATNQRVDCFPQAGEINERQGREPGSKDLELSSGLPKLGSNPCEVTMIDGILETGTVDLTEAPEAESDEKVVRGSPETGAGAPEESLGILQKTGSGNSDMIPADDLDTTVPVAPPVITGENVR
jgi:hypothetical protein